VNKKRKNNMSKHNFITTVLAISLGAGSVHAATVFNGALDSDFTNAGNWSNGFPTNSNAGRIDSTAVLSGSTNFNVGTGNIIVGYNDSATFTIESGSTLTMTGGKLDVGQGANVGTLNVQGGLDTSGAINVINGIMTVDTEFTINGTASILNDGTLSVGTEIDLYGALNFNSGAAFGGLPNKLRNRAGSTMGFEVDASGNHTTLAGDSLILYMAGTSELVVDFLAAPTLGDTFDLITGVEKFALYTGGGTGAFGTVTVTGLGAGQDYSLIYDTTVADAGFLRLEVIPEPATLGIVLAAGTGLLFIRRRFLI
jgi:hypothetical protein